MTYHGDITLTFSPHFRAKEVSEVTGVEEGHAVTAKCISTVIGSRSVWGVGENVIFVSCLNKVLSPCFGNYASFHRLISNHNVESTGGSCEFRSDEPDYESHCRSR
jgi:hypothetical protein